MRSRVTSLVVALVALALLAAAGWRSASPVRAEYILREITGAASAGLTQRAGEYIWIEEEGVGVKLDPIPRQSKQVPRLIAGRTLSGGATLGLWRIGGPGQVHLRKALGGGVQFGESAAFSFQPQGTEEVRGASIKVSFDGGRRGLAASFELDARHFALVITVPGGAAVTPDGLRDEVLSEMVVLPRMADGAIAPLFMEGRYACMLVGWERRNERFHRVSGSGAWQGMRIFVFDGDDFPDLGKLQVNIESALKQAGHDRAGGRGFETADGRRAFDGEYFGGGYIQRVVYQPLGGAYLVALFHGSEKDRAALGVESDLFARSITRVDLNRRKVGPPDKGFHRVRRLRALAWQDGSQVAWGALFDDGRQNPVLWRQRGVAWSARLMQRNKALAQQSGEADSSRELSPLINAKGRALEIPDGTTGEVQLQISIGTESAIYRLTLAD